MKTINLLITMVLLFGFMTTLAQDGNGDGRVWVWQDELNDALADAKIYTTPKDRTYFVRPVYEDWVFRAVSKNAREEWRKTTQMDADERKKIYALLDELAKLASQKLPAFVPGTAMFTYGTDEEKTMLKGKITDVDKIKIHKIGLQDQNWQIEKGDDGIPTGRRKWGYVWFKPNSPTLDHPWCRVFEMYIYQPYSGGGNYGASEAFFERRWLSGCPK
jgi:hypothetical protein